MSPTAPHPLDDVIWTSLTTRHAALAEGAALARRYDPAFSRFGALADGTPQALADLARLVPAGESVALFRPERTEAGPYFEAVGRKELAQMVGPVRGEVVDAERFVELGEPDWPQMQALVQRTEPGPFYGRTPELGRFVGLKVDGQLVAMAGERMRVPGYTEISAVCTDPAWRGRGLAADLMKVIAQGIAARGETPFLHVLVDNASAITVYERLGFTRRLVSQLTILQRNGVAA
jgi:ribosomal protein S18 acetylase RimI-like enzyme